MNIAAAGFLYLCLALCAVGAGGFQVNLLDSDSLEGSFSQADFESLDDLAYESLEDFGSLAESGHPGEVEGNAKGSEADEDEEDDEDDNRVMFQVRAVDPKMSMGFEREYQASVQVTCRETVKDHTLLWETPHLVFTFETQGKGGKKKGGIEAITKEPFAIGTPNGLEELNQALAELDGVNKILRSNWGGRFTTEKALDDVFKPNDEDVVKAGITLAEGMAAMRMGTKLHFPKDQPKVFPQVTVTHALPLLQRIFKGGWVLPEIRMSKKSNTDYRTIVMFDSVTDAEKILMPALVRGLRRDDANLKKNADELKAADPDKSETWCTLEAAGIHKGNMMGFLVLLAQSMKAMGVKYAEGEYISRSGNTLSLHGDSWFKDYFGLLPKTPIGWIFRNAFPEAVQQKVRNVYTHMFLSSAAKKIILVDLARAKIEVNAEEIGRICLFDGEATVADSADGEISIESYLGKGLGGLFSEGPMDEDSYNYKRAVDSWGELIGDTGSNAIMFKDDTGEVRPAFEYRQILGGSIKLAIRRISGLSEEQVPDTEEDQHTVLKAKKKLKRQGTKKQKRS